MHSAFQYNEYLLMRQVLALTGKFRIYNPNGQMVLYSQQKMFKLREDIRVYSDEDRSQELLYIQARSILDFSAAYEVIDSQAGTRIGVLRRRGFRSMMRDTWEVLNAGEQLLGVLQEDSAGLAMLRRFIAGSLLPQNYDLLVNDRLAVDIRQRFNLFRYELDIHFHPEPGNPIDRRLGLAAGILLATIEGRQD